MDNRTGEMDVFVTVADSGSFSIAARKLNLSPSAVSKIITRIENRLGTALLTRTTRQLSLTDEGHVYLDQARLILEQISNLENQITQKPAAEVSGTIKVSASVGFGESFILPLIPKFLEKHPNIEIDLSLNDLVIDLIQERVDVAIRIGKLSDSSLKAKLLTKSARVVVASPDYLAKHGTPRTPAALRQHNCLRFNFKNLTPNWPFKNPKTQENFSIPITGNALGNNGSIHRYLALKGTGIARLGKFHVVEDIKAGRLIPLLDAYNPNDLEQIHAVYLGHRYMAHRVRLFIDFLASEIQK